MAERREAVVEFKPAPKPEQPDEGAALSDVVGVVQGYALPVPQKLPEPAEVFGHALMAALVFGIVLALRRLVVAQLRRARDEGA